jgi:hypothetical protein
MEGGKENPDIVFCERHGLHYNSAKVSGCVVCRREAGEVIGAEPVPAAAASGPRTEPSVPMAAALGLAAALIGVSSIALVRVHEIAVDAFQGFAEPMAAEMAAAEELSAQERAALEELGLVDPREEPGFGPERRGATDPAGPAGSTGSSAGSRPRAAALPARPEPATPPSTAPLDNELRHQRLAERETAEHARIIEKIRAEPPTPATREEIDDLLAALDDRP